MYYILLLFSLEYCTFRWSRPPNLVLFALPTYSSFSDQPCVEYAKYCKRTFVIMQKTTYMQWLEMVQIGLAQ